MIDSISMSKKFDENNTFKAYDIKNVYKCDTSNISQIIEQIRNSNISEKCLVQIPNTVGLTHDIINSLPDNVDVRIVGGYTEEYAKSFSNPYPNIISTPSPPQNASTMQAIINTIQKLLPDELVELLGVLLLLVQSL